MGSCGHVSVDIASRFEDPHQFTSDFPKFDDMTETIPLCAVCERRLSADDRFCSSCGAATRSIADPEATIVVEAASDGSHTPGSEDEITQPMDGKPSGTAPEATSFKARLRHVLGSEFQLLSLLGEGGFARVYKARDLRLDRIVAIKVIRPEVVGTELFTESFRSEGIALAKLRHPGIVPIYDIRERGGLIYYVMPFVQGVTLEKRMNQGRLPPYETRRILSELTDALSAAHRAQMAHLDIKPDNVFLEGDLQKVLLVDFGTAMHVAETVPDASTGPIIGTPAYMSPEQAQGLADIDHRSDLYSLGILGYAMLMGRPPFYARSARDVLKKHVEEAPVPIRDINPSIPKDFADAIMRCLAKDPWERFSTAKELGSALEAVTFFTERRSTTRTTSTDATPRSADRPLILIIAVVAVLGVLIGVLIG